MTIRIWHEISRGLLKKISAGVDLRQALRQVLRQRGLGLLCGPAPAVAVKDAKQDGRLRRRPQQRPPTGAHILRVLGTKIFNKHFLGRRPHRHKSLVESGVHVAPMEDCSLLPLLRQPWYPS